MRRLPPRFYKPALAAACIAVGSIVLYLLVFRLGLCRDVHVRIVPNGADRFAAIEWRSNQETLASNGHWIELQSPHANAAAEQEHIVRLPRYAIDTVSVRSHTPADRDPLVIRSGGVSYNLFGFLATDDGIGFKPAPTEPPPAVLRSGIKATRFSHALQARIPPAPIKLHAITALLSLACSLVLYGLGGFTRWCGGLYNNLLVNRRVKDPGSRAWLVAAIIISCGIPLWLLTWAPAIVSGDGSAYILFAWLFCKTGSWAHFDGWRMPGYAMFVAPFFATMKDYVRGVVTAQTLLSPLLGVVAWAMLRKKAPTAAVGLCVICLAIDPAIFIWSRTVLAEWLTQLLILVGAFVFLCCAESLKKQSAKGWALLLPVVLALTLSAASYVRPNVQMFMVLAPVGLLLIGWKFRTRAMAAVGVYTVTAATAITPFLCFNATLYDTPEMIVGRDWNRAQWMWENGDLDWNQSGVFTPAQRLGIGNECEALTLSSWGFLELLRYWQVPPIKHSGHPWFELNQRAAIVWRESFARRSDLCVRTLLKAELSMFGWPMKTPVCFHGDVPFLLGPMVGDPNAQFGSTNWVIDLRRVPPASQDLYAPTVHPLAIADITGPGHVVKHAFEAASSARLLLSAWLVITLCALLRRRSFALAWLAIIIIIHNLTIPLLVFSGDDRYAMPWYALEWVICFAGLGHGTGPLPAAGRAGEGFADQP